MKKLLYVLLDLFDSGEGGAAAGTQASQNSGRSGSDTGGAKVLYGKVNDAAGSREGPLEGQVDAGQQDSRDSSDAGSEKNVAREAQETPEQRKARFQALIDGEFKDLYTAETQRIINQRFKKEREAQEALRSQMETQKPLVELLAKKYGVQDAGQILSRMQADTSLWEEEAGRSGFTPEQFVEIQRIKMENERLRQTDEQRRRELALRQQVDQWNQEGEALKQTYPGFDMAEAVKNPQFLRLLQSGVPVKTAYEVLNLDAVKTGVAQSVAQATERSVVENIRAKGSRPSENGASGQSGVLIKSDVSKLTKKDRAEIARRAQMGEKISF